MEKSKEVLLIELGNNLLSNKITRDDLSKLLKSIEPNGPRWLKYHCQQILNIDIGINIAKIISDYTMLTIKIYDLSTSPSYSIPNNLSYIYYPKQLTVSFWCKPQCLNQHQTILSTEPNATISKLYGWGFRFRKENKFMFNIMTGDGYGACCILSKTIITNKTVNTWVHCCGTYDSLNGECRLYINGILEGTKFVNQNKYPLQFTSKCDLQIGALPCKSEKFYGYISDFQLYDKPFKQYEINGLLYGSYNDKIILKSENMMEWNNLPLIPPNTQNQIVLDAEDFTNNDESMQVVSTPNRYQYRHWFNVKSNWIKCNVKARNDAHIALGNDKLHNGNHYEIVIGGWVNTASVIRTRNQGTSHYTANGALSWNAGNKYVTLWISWDEEKEIQIGHGARVGDNIFMNMKYNKTIPIKYMSVSNGWGSTGEWQIFNVTMDQ